MAATAEHVLAYKLTTWEKDDFRRGLIVMHDGVFLSMSTAQRLCYDQSLEIEDLDVHIYLRDW